MKVRVKGDKMVTIKGVNHYGGEVLDIPDKEYIAQKENFDLMEPLSHISPMKKEESTPTTKKIKKSKKAFSKSIN